MVRSYYQAKVPHRMSRGYMSYVQTPYIQGGNMADYTGDNIGGD